MSFAEFLRRVRAENEPPGELELLMTRLSAGFVVQGVCAESAQPRGAVVEYRVRLARLGSLSELTLPGVSPAVERWLDQERLRMPTSEQESLRCSARMLAFWALFFAAAPSQTYRKALREWCEQHQPPRALASARTRWPQATGPARSEQLVEAIDACVSSELARLAIGLSYSWDEAGEVVDGALVLVISMI